MMVKEPGRTTTPIPGHLRRLDALRGLAALMVVAFHANAMVSAPIGPGLLEGLRGNLNAGVDLFFVLSGYLIAGPFLRALLSSHRLPDLPAYAARRFARILPAYWAVLLTVLALASFNLPWWQSVVHALLLGSWVPGEAYRVIPVAWTLGVELSFYVAIPVAALALRRSGHCSARALCWWIMGAGLASLAISTVAAWVAPASVDPATLGAGVGQLLQVGFVGKFFLFVPGMLVAVLHAGPGVRQPARPLLRLAAIGALILVGVELSMMLPYFAGAGLRDLCFAISFGLALDLALRLHAAPGRSTRVLAYFGDISYGIYLWHWVFGLYLQHTVHLFPGAPLGVRWLASSLLLLAVTVPIAEVSKRLVEVPGQQAARRWVQRRRAAAAAAVIPI